MIYGDLALKNSALSIEKDNAEYTFLIDNIEETISFRIATTGKTNFKEEELIVFLKNLLNKNKHLNGTFLVVESQFIPNNKKSTSNNYTDTNGNFNIYISRSGIYPFDDYMNTEYYNIPRESMKSFVSNPHMQSTKDKTHKVYTISYPLIINDQFAGVVGCDVSINAINEQLEKISIYNDNATVALLDNNGNYITHSLHPELIDKNLKEDCPDAQTRIKNLREGKVDQWFTGFVGAITNPIYFNGHQTPWQLQAKVHAKYVFENVITAAYWIIPTLILTILYFIFRMRSFISSRIKPLSQLNDISSKIADGDLTHDISIKSDNEIGGLAESFQKMVENLQHFVREIQQGSENITQASQQLGTSSQTLSSSTNEQASTGEEISSNMEEMSASVQQNADKSYEIKNASGFMLAKFNTLNDDAQKAANMQLEIADLSKIINEIAQNIKILSLNAAVEAARAGEHGKGFAVVAREVQKLSENTTSSANKITEKINMSTSMSMQTMEYIKEILPQLTSLNEGIEDINVSSQEQASNVQQVTNATQQFNESTQANAASAEELASTAEELSNQAEVLMDLAKQFKIKE